ncbi:hypothetical protein FB451DRAFT_1174837 [Mycena latifolia]|nr:hypothetical protein FB451DRAFT_1174837 [Mycena latifolia]
MGAGVGFEGTSCALLFFPLCCWLAARACDARVWNSDDARVKGAETGAARASTALERVKPAPPAMSAEVMVLARDAGTRWRPPNWTRASCAKPQAASVFLAPLPLPKFLPSPKGCVLDSGEKLARSRWVGRGCTIGVTPREFSGGSTAACRRGGRGMGRAHLRRRGARGVRCAEGQVDVHGSGNAPRPPSFGDMRPRRDLRDACLALHCASDTQPRRADLSPAESAGCTRSRSARGGKVPRLRARSRRVEDTRPNCVRP